MVEKMEWLNSQEERCCMMLKENARRKKSFEDELTAIRELKNKILENTEIEEEVCSQVPQMDVLVKPIVDWLKTQDPYLEIHISSEYIKVVRTDESIPVSETVSLQNQPSQARY